MHHVSPAMKALLDLIRQHDLLALSLLVFLEEMGIPLPLPGNILLMYLGYLSTRGQASAVAVVLIMTLMSTLGSLTLYVIANHVGRPAILKWGRLFGLEKQRVDRIEAWLKRYGAVTIFLGRVTPALRTPTSAVGGIFGVPWRLFLPYTSLAAFVWTTFWVILGAVVGRSLHLERYTSGSHLIWTLALAALCLAILPTAGFVSARRQRRREEMERQKRDPAGTLEFTNHRREDEHASAGAAEASCKFEMTAGERGGYWR